MKGDKNMYEKMDKNGIKKIIKFENEGIYIYGTGIWGRNVYKELLRHKIKVAGFVVTKKEMNDLFEIPVLNFEEVQDRNLLLILALNQHNTLEVKKLLRSKKYDFSKVVYLKEIMNIEDTRCGYNEKPCIDITTKVGCSINCKYCPQDIFLEQYYQKNANRESLLSLNVLEKCINHMPTNTSYIFAGFAEPFLHPKCIDLVKLICNYKKEIDVYTTLVGINAVTLKDLMRLPINHIILHVADEKGYAKIPLTDEYFEILERAIHGKKSDGKAFVDMCNSQAKPNDKVEKICQGKYKVTSTLLDRAGNLEGIELVSKRINKGPITCGVCGNQLNRNELLPDGTLLLCCMDYGMMHELGNLANQSYNEIKNGKELLEIKKAMKDENEKKILCRMCSCANKV